MSNGSVRDALRRHSSRRCVSGVLAAGIADDSRADVFRRGEAIFGVGNAQSVMSVAVTTAVIQTATHSSQHCLHVPTTPRQLHGCTQIDSGLRSVVTTPDIHC